MRAVFGLGFFLLLAGAALGQSGVTVEVDDVVDNRVSSTDTGGFQMAGSLELRVKLNGTGLDKALAARVIVKEARDDKGNVLTAASTSLPDFTPRDYNSGTLQLAVKQPARAASTVRVKGTLELYVPGRDPNASFKIDKALAKLDTPFTAKALKNAKLSITPLSRDGYAAALKARKLDTKSIEAARAEAKKQGVPDAEVEAALALAQAFESMDGDLPEGSVVLSGKKSDFDRIYRVEILGDDGQPIHITSRGLSSRGESSLMTLQPAQAPPQNATLQFQLLTDKARVSFPFELKVELP
jgi:hypothetical protein